MAFKNIKGLTIELGADTTKLGDALADVNKKSGKLSSELREINKLLKLDPGNTDLLKQKMKVLADAVSNTGEKLDKLKEAEKQVQQQFAKGEVSEEQYRALQREVIATEKKLKSYEGAVKDTEQALKGMGEETKEVTEHSGKLGETLANAAKVGLKAVAAAATAAVGALVAAAESSREYRTEMGKLDTAFVSAGHSSEAAVQTYKTLQGVLGESDQAVEAANHLAKLCDTEAELAKWTDIATGVYATFGASLPIEGLTEAANETAKVGQVTGGLADALNWAETQGMDFGIGLKENIEFTKLSSKELKALTDAQRAEYEARKEQYEEIEKYNASVQEAASAEDKFNIALQNCSTEEERQALITETLNSLYAETAERYRATNAEVIRANEANEAWAASMAEVGGTIEPILSDVKLLGASVLSEFVPGVEQVAEAFRGMMMGDADVVTYISDLTGMTEESVQELQALGKEAGYTSEEFKELASVLAEGDTGVQATITNLLSGSAGIGEALSGMFTQLGSKLAELIPTVAEIASSLVSTLVTGIVENLPQMAQSAVDMLTSFTNGFQSYFPVIVQKGSEILTNLVTGISQNLPSLVSQALDAVMTFATTLYDSAPQLIKTGFNLLSNLVRGVLNCIPTLLSKVPEIVSKFANIINDNFPTILKMGFEMLWQIITGILSAIPDLIANIPKIITAIVDVWEAFNWLQLGKKAITLLRDGIKSMLSAVKTAGKNILDGITNIIKDLPSKLLEFGKNAVSNLGSAIKNGLSTVKNAATSILNGVVDTVKSLPSKMLQIGKDLVQGLWNGISNMTGWIIGKIQGFGDSVLSGIKSFFGIKSPSRVFRDEVGAMLAEGMALGIERNASAPINAMRELSSDLLGEAESMNGMTLERRMTHTFAAPVPAGAANNSALLSKLDGIYERLGRLQIVLDSGTLVGETIDKIDRALATKQMLTALGV